MAIHRDDANNPHAHVMLTMREIGPEGFGKKVREWNERELIAKWHEAWAHDVNRVFEKANRPERIDHRSLEKQGITDRVPTIHEGPTVRDMEKKGKQTDRGDINRAAKTHNAIVYEMQSYLKQREEILQGLAQIQGAPQPKSMKQVDEEHNDLYNQRREKISEIKKLETTLKQIEQRDLLLQERERLKEKIKEIEPKGFLQRIRKANENEIRGLHRDLDRVENRIINEHKYTPNREEIPIIQKEMSVLHGAFKAMDRAFQEIGRQRSQMQQEERMRRMRQQAKSPAQDRDREWER
ncbi:MobA/MobL family protein [Paenibacillus solisilvae]|uniref:MobA/MobL family protein n=1 Tax=Paenibacillus solisilvae TaxID=2486751 RepID=A0ABW0WAG9_9BACL